MSNYLKLEGKMPYLESLCANNQETFKNAISRGNESDWRGNESDWTSSCGPFEYQTSNSVSDFIAQITKDTSAFASI